MTGAPNTMRIARYRSNRDVRVEEASRPSIGDGEVLLRLLACGICASDTLEWFRVPKAPRILGHEITGVVHESRSDFWAVGDRVVGRNQVPCQQCYACRHGHHAVCESQTEMEPGGMAEYVRVPREVAKRGLWALPAGLSPAAGTLTEPLACVLHAQELTGLRAGWCVVVVGCGAFGLLHVAAAVAAGASAVLVVEPQAGRRAAALRSGATVALGPDDDVAAAVRELNDGRLADLAVVATGAPAALTSASDVLARYATALLFAVPEPDAAVPLSLNRLFWRRELRLVSSYGAGGTDFGEALAMLEKGVPDPRQLISHIVPLSDVQHGFDVVSAARGSLKVVLDLTR